MQQAKVQNVTMNITDSGNNNESNNGAEPVAEADDSKQLPAKVKDLTKQLSELSKKLNAYACCQQPFTQELEQYLVNSFQDQELIKRP